MMSMMLARACCLWMGSAKLCAAHGAAAAIMLNQRIRAPFMCMGRIIVMHIHSDLGAAWLKAFFSVLMKLLFT